MSAREPRGQQQDPSPHPVVTSFLMSYLLSVSFEDTQQRWSLRSFYRTRVLTVGSGAGTERGHPEDDIEGVGMSPFPGMSFGMLQERQRQTGKAGNRGSCRRACPLDTDGFEVSLDGRASRSGKMQWWVRPPSEWWRPMRSIDSEAYCFRLWESADERK